MTVTATVSRYSHGGPSLRTGAGGITVWIPQDMAQRKEFNELDNRSIMD
jgi:hypothetical protein